MSVVSPPMPSTTATRRPFGVNRVGILVLGVIVAAFVITVVRRQSPVQVVVFVVVGVLVILSALGLIAAASDLLLTRLDLIAETNLLNR